MDMVEERDDAVAEIEGLIDCENASKIDHVMHSLSPPEAMHTFARLGKRHQTRMLELLRPDRLSDFVSKAFGIGGEGLLEELSLSKKIAVIRRMRSDGQVKALRKLKERDARAVLKAVRPRRAREIQDSMGFEEDTAGGMMISDYLAFSSISSVDEVSEDIRRNSEQYTDYDIQYAYVISESGALVGVLRLRDILLSPKGRPIASIMIRDPLRVNRNASLKELLDFFLQHPLLGVPVVDDDNTLVGVVRNAAVREAGTKHNNQLFLKFAGIVGGEEYRTMPLFKRSSRRLSWLSINIVLNLIAASVIALYQDTLEQVIVLAVFLPIVSDMSGCSGNQAVAVSIRELTLGLVRPRELLHVLRKEMSIGVINGLTLGCILGTAALMWKGNPYLGLVVGAALAVNTIVAVSVGGLVPLFLKGLRMDPALASSPLLTTITDMCGFFFVLSLASFLLPRLSG